MFEEKIYGFNLGNQKIKISTGKIARQAGGSVVVQCGGTMLLVTATRSKDVREGQDFFPLTVDYIEKFYASGKFPGGFIKRETKPGTDEVLISRLIDRPIRPLFPEGFLNAVHIVVTVLSYDEVNYPENLATIGVSAALGLSDIPFAGTVAGVTVGYINGEYILNPTGEQLLESEIQLSVAGTKDAVTMVEAGAKEVSEEVMLEAIMFGHEKIKEICAEQDKFLEQFDVQKYEFEKKEVDPEIKEFIDSFENEVEKAIMTPGKLEKYEAIDNLEIELFEKYVEKLENEDKEIDENLEKEFKKYYREEILPKDPNYKKVKFLVSTGTYMIPGVGEVKLGIEIFVGEDLLTKEKYDLIDIIQTTTMLSKNIASRGMNRLENQLSDLKNNQNVKTELYTKNQQGQNSQQHQRAQDNLVQNNKNSINKTQPQGNQGYSGNQQVSKGAISNNQQGTPVSKTSDVNKLEVSKGSSDTTQKVVSTVSNNNKVGNLIFYAEENGEVKVIDLSLIHI